MKLAHNYPAARPEAEQVLVLCSAFSVGLQACRIIYTGELLFSFLVWNLFLAWIPYLLSEWMNRAGFYKNRFLLAASFFVWLVFVPNSFYIITDLVHLEMNYGVPVWYDLALLLSFAWSGLLLGIISVRQMEKLFEKFFGRKAGLVFVLPVMLLNGLGVYVGRYLRFNSWDVITNPFELAGGIIELYFNPLRNAPDLGMIMCYSVLLAIIYLTVKTVARSWH